MSHKLFNDEKINVRIYCVGLYIVREVAVATNVLEGRSRYEAVITITPSDDVFAVGLSCKLC